MPLQKLVDHWKPTATAAIAVGGFVWYGVTQADEVMRNAREVPALKVAVLELQQSQKLQSERNQILESKLLADSNETARVNAEQLALLKKIAEVNGVRGY